MEKSAWGERYVLNEIVGSVFPLLQKYVCLCPGPFPAETSFPVGLRQRDREAEVGALPQIFLGLNKSILFIVEDRVFSPPGCM